MICSQLFMLCFCNIQEKISCRLKWNSDGEKPCPFLADQSTSHPHCSKKHFHLLQPDCHSMLFPPHKILIRWVVQLFAHIYLERFAIDMFCRFRLPELPIQRMARLWRTSTRYWGMSQVISIDPAIWLTQESSLFIRPFQFVHLPSLLWMADKKCCGESFVRGRFVGRSQPFFFLICVGFGKRKTMKLDTLFHALFWLIVMIRVRVSLLSYNYCVFGNMLMFHPGLLLLSQIISRAVVKVVIPTDRYVNKRSSLIKKIPWCCVAVWPAPSELYNPAGSIYVKFFFSLTRELGAKCSHLFLVRSFKTNTMLVTNKRLISFSHFDVLYFPPLHRRTA